MSEESSLHEAVLHGNVSAVLAFLKNEKVDVNERDTNGNTPLLLAVCIKDEPSYNSILKILIENEADVNAGNKGITPLYNAVFYQKQKAVEMLVKAGARINHKNLLHIAAQNGCKAILQLLLDDKRCTEEVIDAEDDRGRTPVYIAAQFEHKDCLKMLIRKGADLSRSCSDDETVMDAIFEQIIRPVDLMLEVFDDAVFRVKTQEKNQHFADFSVLAPRHRPRQMAVISSLLVAANDEEKTELLQHPLIELYLTLKWAKICYFFYLWIAAYIVFVLSMSVYVTILTHNYKAVDGVLTAARWILIISATCLLGHAVLECWLTHRNHFRKYEMWLNLACTSLSLIVAIVENRAGNQGNIHNMPNWVLHVTSAAILLSWTELMLLIGRLPTYGYYALMFSTVLQNVIKVLLAFLCLVVGFALSFSIQFSSSEQFADPWRALVKTMVMMMGEFEYGDLFADKGPERPPTSRVIFLMFIILTSIVLMNLMVGLAVNDIQSLQMESHARKLEKQADFLAQLEKVISSKRFESKYVPKFIKRVLKRSRIDTMYELKTSAQFRRSKKLSSKLIGEVLHKLFDNLEYFRDSLNTNNALIFANLAVTLNKGNN